MKTTMSAPLRLTLLSIATLAASVVFTSCGTAGKDQRNKMVVSVRDQRMVLIRDGQAVKTYTISTSKFGVGDRPGSNCTPLGRMEVAKKIGGSAPNGAVFKNRRATGEVLRPNTPGRDPIVSRIMWLRGTEAYNANTYNRCIYIHGTPEEWRLGSPASYGCIRMASKDVVDLYSRIGEGAEIYVQRAGLYQAAPVQSRVVSNNAAGMYHFKNADG